MFIRNQYFQAVILACICAILFPAVSRALDIPALTSMGVVRPYKNSWVIYETDNFRVYTRGRRFARMAQKALSILEKARVEFQSKTGFVSSEKISVFLYKNMIDYYGSNIGRDYLSPKDTGFDDPMKFRMALPVNKSSRVFRWTLRRRLMSLYFFQNLFGQSKSVTRFVKLAWRSQWINEGLNGLFGGVNLPVVKMVAQDAVLHGNSFDMGELHWFGYLKPEERRLAEAQSVILFHYISGLTSPDEMKNMFLDYRYGYSNHDYLKKFTGKDGGALFASWEEDEKRKMQTREKPDSFSERLTPATEIIASFQAPAPIPGSEDFVCISNVDIQPEIYRFSRIGNKWERKRLIGWNRLLSVTRIRQTGSPLSVSRDGRYLFFFGDYGIAEYLFRIELNSGQLKKFEIPTDDAYSPSASPDGARVAFTGIKNGDVDLYIWKYETGELTRLTDTPEDEGYAAWSPDGKQIAYSRETDGQWDLGIISLEGKSKSRALTLSARDEIQPAWSEEEGVILFSASEEVGHQLYSLNVITGELKALTNTQGGAFNPAPFKGGVLFEQYEDMSSSVRWARPSAKGATMPAPPPPPVADSGGEIAIRESDSGSLFSRSFSLPLVLASVGDESSNNELLWIFGVNTGIVSQGVKAGNSRAFFVPRGNIRYTNKLNLFDITANIFYQSRDLTDNSENNEGASNSSFREREKYGGNIGISYSPTENVTFGAGYTGFRVNKRQLIDDAYKNYFDSGVYAQIMVNHILQYNLYPEYGYLLHSKYSLINSAFGADNNYGIYYNKVQAFFPAFEKVVAGINMDYDFSDGEFPTYFDLGWQSGLKGIELNKYEGTHRFVARATLERPFYIDSRFSAAYSTLRDMRVILFADMGAVTDNSPFKNAIDTYRKSVGIHVRLDIYWLQEFGVPIGIYYASEVDSDNPDSILSITAGMNF